MISRLPLKITHTTANKLKSKMKKFEFRKDTLTYFAVEQQNLNVLTNADATYLLIKAIKLIPSHQQKILYNTFGVLYVR